MWSSPPASLCSPPTIPARARRAATALAAYEGRDVVELADVRRIATLALRHRLRKDPLETQDDAARIDRAVAEVLV